MDQDQCRLCRRTALTYGKPRKLPIIVLHGALDLGIHGNVDRKAAVIDPARGLCARNAILQHQVSDHVLQHHVDIPGIDPILTLRGRESHTKRLVARRKVILLSDHALPSHLGKDQIPPPQIVLGMADGMIIGRAVGDRRQGGALCKRKLVHTLGKIMLSSLGHALAPIRKVDHVKIPLQDLALVQTPLQIQGVKDLLELAPRRYLIVPRHVFDELLRDGRAAKLRGKAKHAVEPGGNGSIPINTLVLVKALILDRQKSVFQIDGDIRAVNQKMGLLRIHSFGESLPLPRSGRTVGEGIPIKRRRSTMLRIQQKSFGKLHGKRLAHPYTCRDRQKRKNEENNRYRASDPSPDILSASFFFLLLHLPSPLH